MKYCQYCGAQVSDNAQFCAACGKQLAEQPLTFAAPVAQPQPSPAPEQPKLLQPKTPSTGLYTMNFLFRLFAGFVIFLLLLAIGNAGIDAYSTLREGYYSTDVNTYAYFEPEEAASAFAFLFSIPTMVFGVICFVKTLTQRLRVNYVYAAILKLLTGFALFIGSIAIIP